MQWGQQKNSQWKGQQGSTGATLLGEAGHYVIELLLEAHVEEAVRLVQHQHLQPLQLHAAAPLHQVRQAPGRPHQHVCAPFSEVGHVSRWVTGRPQPPPSVMTLVPTL